MTGSGVLFADYAFPTSFCCSSAPSYILLIGMTFNAEAAWSPISPGTMKATPLAFYWASASCLLLLVEVREMRACGVVEVAPLAMFIVLMGFVVEKLRRERDLYRLEPISRGGSCVFLTPVRFGSGFLTLISL